MGNCDLVWFCFFKKAVFICTYENNGAWYVAQIKKYLIWMNTKSWLTLLIYSFLIRADSLKMLYYSSVISNVLDM